MASLPIDNTSLLVHFLRAVMSLQKDATILWRVLLSYFILRKYTSAYIRLLVKMPWLVSRFCKKKEKHKTRESTKHRKRKYPNLPLFHHDTGWRSNKKQLTTTMISTVTETACTAAVVTIERQMTATIAAATTRYRIIITQE